MDKGSRGVFFADVGKRTFNTRHITGRSGAVHLVIERARLHALAALPVLVAVKGGKSTQHHHQHAGDQGAVAAPEMLERVKLLLFFEVEMFCHGVQE